MKKIINKPLTLIILFTLIGVFFRFYNLDWGAPYYFHPDERNIVSSVTQLHYPNNLNPNFFAYGSLPIYLIYFKGILLKSIQCTNSACDIFTIPFNQIVIISRLYSALFSTLLIPLVYLIGKKIHSNQVGLIASFLATFSVGLIQFAHFGTFEMWITFFSLLLLYCCLFLAKKPNVFYLLLSGVILGILVATKVSNIVLALLPILSLLSHKIKSVPLSHKKGLTLIKNIVKGIYVISIATVVFFISNPYVISAFDQFRSSMRYESSVALGTLPVFYTQEFYTSIPIIFQFIHVYPFIANPLITIMFIPSFTYVIWQSLKNKNKSFFLLWCIFFLLFISQAFLFVKWVRYMVPTLPFIYLIISIAITDLAKKFHKKPLITYSMFALLCLSCILFSISYFHTVLNKQDTRIEAKNWAKDNLDSNQSVMSETYDLGIVPFNQLFNSITLCNTYDLEVHQYICNNNKSLAETMGDSSILILPSQRIYKSRLINKEKYPLGNNFYESIIKQNNEFKKVYETPCDIFCKILYLGNPTFRYEQTANVFDRPTILIYEKYY